MKYLFLIPLLFAFALPATALTGNSFIYSKITLKIIPKEPEPQADQADKEPDKKKEDVVIDPTNLMPTLKRVTKEFTVEVRTQQFLEQKDFISHQPFNDKEGLIIFVEPPQKAQVNATRMIESADVFFVDEDGNITKIAPDLQLFKLSEPIGSGKPIHAFLYLKAGTATANDIRVGDRIENAAFKTHPTIIQ